MRVLVTGAGGQLATDLVSVMAADAVTALNHAQLDITSNQAVLAAMERHQPDAVINTAAYHQVDRCETEPELSFAINAAATQRLAIACRNAGVLLVHLSTDYVFNGLKREPYDEGDPVAPLSVYGASKAGGEMAVRATTDRHLIVRTTGLYGQAGRSRPRGNFVETMLKLADQQAPIAVVSDQVLTPSYTLDVAWAISALIHAGARGTVHVTSAGQCSWYEFAAHIFECMKLHPNLTAIAQAQRPAAARRPAYSVLGHRRLRELGIPEPPPWQDALAAYLGARSRI
ncbi:MAG: dTDP-4-dehydrorhamnose reductase [Chloroflexota bacterium]